MSHYLETYNIEAQSEISNLIYGDNVPIFISTEMNIVDESNDVRIEVPALGRSEDTTVLTISEAGAEHWRSKLSNQCDFFDIDPAKLYVSTGLALVELTLAAQASLEGDDSIRGRVMKAYKAIGKDENVRNLGLILQEQTHVDVKKILDAFSYEELLDLNHLRYGIGIALRALGLKPKQVDQFRASSRQEAVKSLDNYFAGAASFLIHQEMPEGYILRRDFVKDTVDKATAKEPPVLEFAAASPMNVTYILSK